MIDVSPAAPCCCPSSRKFSGLSGGIREGVAFELGFACEGTLSLVLNYVFLQSLGGAGAQAGCSGWSCSLASYHGVRYAPEGSSVWGLDRLAATVHAHVLSGTWTCLPWPWPRPPACDASLA